MSKNFIPTCPLCTGSTLVLLQQEEAGVDVISESDWGQTRCTDEIRHLDNERQLKFEESAALKTGHSPSWTMLSFILNITLSNALPPFPHLPLLPFQQLPHHSFLLTLTDLTPPPPPSTRYDSNFHEGTSGMVFIIKTSDSSLLLEERTHRWGRRGGIVYLCHAPW